MRGILIVRPPWLDVLLWVGSSSLSVGVYTLLNSQYGVGCACIFLGLVIWLCNHVITIWVNPAELRREYRDAVRLAHQWGTQGRPLGDPPPEPFGLRRLMGPVEVEAQRKVPHCRISSTCARCGHLLDAHSCVTGCCDGTPQGPCDCMRPVYHLEE